MLLSGVISGCISQENPVEDEVPTIEEKSDLEVVNYTVETQKLNIDRKFEKLADGFFFSDDAYRYLVRGEVKNNGTKNISKAYVYVNFYDSNGTLIHQIFDMIFNVVPNDIEDFTADFTKYDGEGFRNADHIKFTFKQE
jgi:hypothetical protein